MKKNDFDRDTRMDDQYVTISKFAYKNITDITISQSNEIRELSNRINKAIEYIINNWYELNTVNIENVVDLGKDIRITLFNILKGDSDE